MAVYSRHRETPRFDSNDLKNRKGEIEDTAVRSQLTLSELEKKGPRPPKRHGRDSNLRSNSVSPSSVVG